MYKFQAGSHRVWFDRSHSNAFNSREPPHITTARPMSMNFVGRSVAVFAFCFDASHSTQLILVSDTLWMWCTWCFCYAVKPTHCFSNKKIETRTNTHRVTPTDATRDCCSDTQITATMCACRRLCITPNARHQWNSNFCVSNLSVCVSVFICCARVSQMDESALYACDIRSNTLILIRQIN